MRCVDAHPQHAMLCGQQAGEATLQDFLTGDRVVCDLGTVLGAASPMARASWSVVPVTE